MYPDVDPWMAEVALAANPKYSSPAPKPGVSDGQLTVPPAESRLPCWSNAQAPTVEWNSCPAALYEAGAVPDQVGVAVCAPVAVTVPRKIAAANPLFVPENLTPAWTQVAPPPVRPVHQTAELEKLMTSTASRFPAAWLARVSAALWEPCQV